MNKQIGFEHNYEDVSLYKIMEFVPNYSQSTIYTKLLFSELKELITKHFGNDLVTTTKKQFTVFKDSPTKISEYYTFVSAIGTDIAITYSIEDFSEDEELDELDDIDVYDEDEHGEIEMIDVPMEHEISSNTDMYVLDLSIYYNDKTESKYNAFLEELNTCINMTKEQNIFYTIGVNSYGFNLIKQTTIVANELDIALNYGEDFVPVYESILDNLKTKFHGLILLHGEPGTGKTTIIRQIIASLCNDKKIIYIPAFMIEQLANPEFITFIQKHKESVLILEDAEFALQSRNEEYGAQAVSNLLNITNGLLNDAVKIQVIATFNMDKANIDKALLRHGRLLNDWKFDKLSVEDSKKLVKHLNKNTKVNKPMTIAEIYSEPLVEQKSNKKTKKRIGF